MAGQWPLKPSILVRVQVPEPISRIFYKMTIFFALLVKIIPLYFIILFGFLAGKFLNAKKETIASILIYIISPIIVFSGAIKTEITASNLSLPVVIFLFCSFMAVLFLFLSKFIWQDSTRNIISFAAGAGNMGYFGLPVALAIFGEQYLSLAVLCILGLIIYENSLGFYIVAKGNFTAKESFTKLLKLPAIYAFFIGITINFLGINLGKIYDSVVFNFQGAYTVLGMMVIGMALAGVKKIDFDIKFISLAFTAKFLVWPILMFGLIFLDNNFLHFFNEAIYRVMMLMAIVPMAANAVVYATLLRVHPEKTAMAVFLSTVFALFYIPLITVLLF